MKWCWSPPLFCTYRKLSGLKPSSTFSYSRRSSCHHQQWSSHYESVPETRSPAQRKHPAWVSVHLEEPSGQSVCAGQFGSGVCGAREQSKLVIFSAFLFSSSAYSRKGWELTWFTTNIVNGSLHCQKKRTEHNSWAQQFYTGSASLRVHLSNTLHCLMAEWNSP